MASSKKFAPPQNGGNERAGELVEDYISYSAQLSDHLVLTMLVDRRGRLQCTSLSGVAEFSEEAVRGITEELVVRLGEPGEFRLGCYGSDMRADLAECLTDLVLAQVCIADWDIDGLFDSLAEVGETA